MSEGQMVIGAGLEATGAGDASTIRISGSEVYGRDSVALYADGNIDVVAAQNTSEQRSENSSSDWNARVAVSYSSCGWAAGVATGGNAGKGSPNNWLVEALPWGIGARRRLEHTL